MTGVLSLLCLVAVMVSLVMVSLWWRDAWRAAPTAEAAPQVSPQLTRSKRTVATRARFLADHDEASDPKGALQASSADDQSRAAEEQYRGAWFVPSTSVAPAPPPPPRASVDPEPAVPDDPQDFELR